MQETKTTPGTSLARITNEIIRLKTLIIADNGGVAMLSATSVSKSLAELNPWIGDVRDARLRHTVITALGKRGLDLPAINKNSHTRYAIALAGGVWDAEKIEMRIYLATLTEKQFEELEVG